MSSLDRGQRSLPITLKIQLYKKASQIFVYFTQKNFLLDLLNFGKVWFWDGCGFMRYVQFSSFSGPLSTTGVTKRVISWTRNVFTE